ncbi:uncharacterized protein LOC143146967 [Ptiloglossa arizonensis]|uniref:uncharacterized protein LOC143146967 n=1 Tax=Ptiloglossa arizonensis TaxID=3350558 RepID=UPI003FA11A3F
MSSSSLGLRDDLSPWKCPSQRISLLIETNPTKFEIENGGLTFARINLPVGSKFLSDVTSIALDKEARPRRAYDSSETDKSVHYHGAHPRPPMSSSRYENGPKISTCRSRFTRGGCLWVQEQSRGYMVVVVERPGEEGGSKAQGNVACKRESSRR